MYINNNNFILGGGISGLIFKLYNPSFEIISPELGGELKNNLNSVSWIHDTVYTRNLMLTLDLPIKTSKSKIGYFYEGSVKSDCSEDKALYIIKKKMTDAATGKIIDNFKIPSLKLSVESNVINTLCIDMNVLINKLSANITYIKDQVTAITDNTIALKSGKVLEYDNLVSTIPAVIFWKLYGINKTFSYLPMTIIESPDKFPDYDDNYDLIYYADKYLFTRVCKKDGVYSYEFTGAINSKMCTVFNKMNITKETIVPIGRIISTVNDPPNSKILFLGRFAQWNHDLKIQDSVKTSILYA